MSTLRTLIEDFANQLSAVIESDIMARARATMHKALGGNGFSPVPGRRGRPPGSSRAAIMSSSAGRPRKKAPRQLCPVPGCKNPAAPIFGMVCSKHKDVAKAKIKKYREARRTKKLAAR